LDHQGRVAETRDWRTPTAQELTLKGKAWEAFGQQYGDSGCALFLWAARRLCGLTLRELGVAAGAGKDGAASMSVSAVSKTIRRLEQRALRDKSLRTLQSRILEMSNVQP
jgi:hypothetical protein